MTSLLIYDEHCGWSPSLNASKGTGGAEMHLVGLATWLAGRGIGVEAFTHTTSGYEAGVWYQDSLVGMPRMDPFILRNRPDFFLSVRRSRVPDQFFSGAPRLLAFQVDDPRHRPHEFDHLKRSTLVCLSEWQANLFREMGHTAVVIPSHIPDEYYRRADNLKTPGRIGCLSAWNKGTRTLLDEWKRAPVPGKSLLIGCPYSEPEDAASQCAEAGAIWIGRLKPDQWMQWMGTLEAHVRVCTMAETFGVTDAIARAVGARTHVWCQGEIGALGDTLGGVGVYQNGDEWRAGIAGDAAQPDVERFRASRVLPMWLDLLGENR